MGQEVTDDRKMFEFLVLESAQAGLSWITILRKRENYRKAFAGFDVHKVAAFTDDDVERLMQDPGIVRNRRKIEAAVTNARLFIEIQREFGSFCRYLKSFLPDNRPVVNHWKTMREIPASTALSDAISRDMKNAGSNFSAPLSATPTCRPWDMSTTTLQTAIAESPGSKMTDGINTLRYSDFFLAMYFDGGKAACIGIIPMC